MARHKRYGISTTVQELMVIKIALGFFRRTAPRHTLIWQSVCRLEPEIEFKITKLQKLEEKPWKDTGTARRAKAKASLKN
jgi:hypothetical protein